ncbi:major facilitator superfamily MFS_1 [Caldalkalibacillus thermarum TA2.A1]|uniref:MFS transporter n=1 Tax=Caldalkalibacillus thermarum (strain TA2.A1) TaxID=986075 RepID=F5L483_CALTT|nr:MFS transporter [Caldalkalibacillus thermarum]EGL83848.1 major facilitator superfamily MFS_1 [Caldalkalibacillus thermarum TA2.A1]QZT34102.1 MFS transporter [Caldalkalibacillus thermarum TA2.A1]
MEHHIRPKPGAAVLTSGQYWLITIFLGLCGLMVVSSVYTMIPINLHLVQTFAVPESMAALTSGVFAWFYGLGFLVFGPLSDRISPKKIIIMGLAALAVATVLVSWAQSIEQLIVSRAVQGFIAASFAPVALAYIFEVMLEQRRATSIAFLSTGYMLAGIIGQLISSLVTQIWDWSAVYVLFAGLYGFIFLLAIKILPLTQVQPSSASMVDIWKNTFCLFKEGMLLRCYWITFTLLLSFVALYAALSGYLSNTYGLSTEQIFSIRAAGIVGMLVSPFAGRLIGRFGLKRVLLTGLILATGGLFLVWAMSTVLFLTMASIIYVAGLSITFPALMNTVGQLGRKKKGGAITLYTFVLFMGASAGAVIAPWASFKVIALVLAMLLAASVVVSLGIRVAG